ncbi:DUF2325 domain-containing protein [Lujinxingia vulgaris]|uniref:DUF2325 domain-containing protein n=1 Tax=Lujinxingia vulgaris TaxID=2600176 RepID=A0A5C6X3H2_9DELT|nr:DUF2325 domain-containing protein [Lujinxingia vulgaris]TXD34820.1 DUF2325 domain-containing protein [Lujinxingia vulgaris]
MDDAGQRESVSEEMASGEAANERLILSKSAELGGLIDQARALRALLVSLSAQAAKSAARARALREERARLEARLDAIFCELGAQVFDLFDQGRALEVGEGTGSLASCEADATTARDCDAATDAKVGTTHQGQVSEEVSDEARLSEATSSMRPEEPARKPPVLRVASSLSRTMKLRAGAKSQPATGARLVAHLLPDIRDQLGEPPLKVGSYAQVVGELGKLKAATDDDRLRAWEELPDEVQVALGCMITARYRHLQDETPAACRGVVQNDKDAVKILHRLSNHFSITRAGFVHGLARDHHPAHGARWSEDAAYYHRELARLAHDLYGEEVEEQSAPQNPERALGQIEALIDKSPPVDRIRALVEDILSTPGGLGGDDPRLVRLMRPFRDHLSGAALSKLRHAIDAAEAEKDAEPDFVEELLPEGWPWHAVLQNSRVVMVGGDTRSEAQARIENIFRPGSFEWIPVKKGENMRQVQALAGRMQKGSVDIVILLTDFLSHKASDQLTDAAGKSSVELVYCNRGYGVAQLREGIENFVKLDRAERSEA